MPINRQYLLKRRPSGQLSDDDLELHEAELPELGPGEIRLRSLWVSVDPTNRVWLSDVPQYMPPVEIGAVVRATVASEVIESTHPGFAVGDRVAGLTGWQTHPQGKPEELRINKIPPGVDPTQALALFGVASGVTAYFGLIDITAPKAGETLVVDAASGSVGGLVGQIGKILGCRVIGITGGADKVRYITEELGFDAGIDYKSQDVGEELARLCPDGVDICFENVGGPIFDAVLANMKNHGRVSLCGLVAGYNEAGERQPGPYNFRQVLMKRLRLEGFIIIDYIDRLPEALGALGKWAAEGKLKARVYTLEGFGKLPDALRELVGGQSAKLGKMLVKIAD